MTVLPPSVNYCIETVGPSGDHHCIDIYSVVVSSSDHCRNEPVPPSRDHYGTTKVAPPSDHLHTKITFTKSLGVGHGPVPPLAIRAPSGHPLAIQ